MMVKKTFFRTGRENWTTTAYAKKDTSTFLDYLFITHFNVLGLTPYGQAVLACDLSELCTNPFEILNIRTLIL